MNKFEGFIMDMCEGNPGALSFIVEAISKSETQAIVGLTLMQQMNIKGAKLYMLWNDCCERNTEKAIKVMLTMPEEEIKRHINYEHGRGIKIDNPIY